MKEPSPLQRPFRVRFAQIDGARVIFYPRYIEMVAETFPECVFPELPFSLDLRFRKSNRLGDLLQLEASLASDGWTVRGLMPDEHFSVALSALPDAAAAAEGPGVFESAPVPVGHWMCGPNGRLQLSRYFEQVSAAVEQWFETTLQLPFRELHVVREYGIPTVQLRSRFYRLPALAETIDFRLRVDSVGNSALGLTWWLQSAGKVCAQTKQTLVFVELNDKKIRPVAWPPALRERLLAALAAGGAG